VPNAVDPAPPSIRFRSVFGISEESPLLLHVANFWPVKNHLNLLEMFRRTPAAWRLALIGHPSEDLPYFRRVQEAASRDGRVLLIPGLPPDQVSSALEEADIVLLPSLGEVSPLVILEAMSHAKPWVATPECGAAVGHAGGLIAELEDFPSILGTLLGNKRIREALGEAGRLHWRACHSWEVVGRAWDELIQNGKVTGSFEMPPAIAQQKARLAASARERPRPGLRIGA
jgi:glycosyltransferase involved in cell wall biosynthesis